LKISLLQVNDVGVCVEDTSGMRQNRYWKDGRGDSTNHELQPTAVAIHGLTDDIELIKMFSGQYPQRE
jgi:hypothetical protein